MRLAILVTLAALMAGCGVRVHYTYRGYAYGYGRHQYYGYSTSHGSTGIVWNQPAPTAPPPPAIVATENPRSWAPTVRTVGRKRATRTSSNIA